MAFAIGLSACGDEDDPQSSASSGQDQPSAQVLRFTLTDQGKELKIGGPSKAEAGRTEITLENNGKRSGELQMIRVEGDRSVTEIEKGFADASAEKPLPDWFLAGGGISATAAGKDQTVTQVLEPGTYFAVNSSSTSPLKIEVSGEPSDEELESDTTISAIDYGFETNGLSAGRTEIAFENNGAQPHHILAAPLAGESTAEDAERFFKSEKGKSPLEAEGSWASAVLEGGESQLVTLDLKPGRYVIYCFISDRQGGPPHALKGMVDEVEVK